ncbi:enterotoxin A family protein [Bartonella schoenbuchensis]|uniref:CtxA-like, cholera toxin A subunit n=1 Tax=Bartonella schoenbuchensis m07a TaxID=1094496 RepID=N6UEP5_9HYPH|nr:enterotoxin A family protein [Bartonella schoenbuchensis]ENN91019.1 CtxA-like, cholera toxin A subunit [Bartonella schoenbuchensis m07a]
MKKLIFSFLIFLFSFSVLADDLNDKIVYRADTRSPKEIKKAKGFYPWGIDGSRPFAPPSDINLLEHVTNTDLHPHALGLRGGYVSTTTSQDVAINLLYSHGWTSPSYVYHIRITPNLIDVNAALRQYSPYPDQYEMAALGGIRWEQVTGWERVINGNVVGGFIQNPDYVDALYGNFSRPDPQPQLAGFPHYHEAWHFEPWVNFAVCGLKSECSPTKSAQEFGTDWFWKSYHAIVERAMVVLE